MSNGCNVCGGLIAKPGEVMGWGGKFCHCSMLNNAYRITAAPAINPCNCIGPQNGQPVCPCQMKGVTIKDGRYIKIQDLGPAHETTTPIPIR